MARGYEVSNWRMPAGRAVGRSVLRREAMFD